MPSTGQLVVGIAVVLLVVGVVFLVVRAVKRHQADVASLSPSDRELHDRCLAADKDIKTAERELKSTSAKADKAVKEAKEVPIVASVEGHSLTPLEVTVNKKTYLMGADVRAELESLGEVTGFLSTTSSTHKSTGLAVGAGVGHVAGGAHVSRGKTYNFNEIKKLDTREIYFVVTGRGWSEVSSVSPEAGLGVRQFVHSVNAAAQGYEEFERQYRALVESVTNEGEQLTASAQQRVEDARAARELLGDDPLKRLQSARRADRTK
ncbi:hypothetical protein H5392_11365 [Tessaracoccus sp. MC1865]|uniref:hypothetical protein n=1 Tax=Tessaracoccus sp. MC1865 TaxID=2760310 RepID=UPI0015FFB235|nr:hypothetical protein [Tessaracoccus sp. MC1865]MBB1484450.1 hypothetical protein [Tessaracoccus sp. MC1865]QTO38445.1 hypothetical protein J7D54_04965 [Tessaracoccus sp. MC1865]